MSSGTFRPFVSVKFSPVGPALPSFSFLSLPSRRWESGRRRARRSLAATTNPPVSALNSRRQGNCANAEGRALATVTRAVGVLAARKMPLPLIPNCRWCAARRARTSSPGSSSSTARRSPANLPDEIRERGLAMKLARWSSSSTVRGSSSITPEGRVDFRELVRDMAAHFRIRIEMRQIGVRDEARMLGGYGVRAGVRCVAPRSSKVSNPSRSRWRSSRTSA